MSALVDRLARPAALDVCGLVVVEGQTVTFHDVAMAARIAHALRVAQAEAARTAREHEEHAAAHDGLSCGEAIARAIEAL